VSSNSRFVSDKFRMALRSCTLRPQPGTLGGHSNRGPDLRGIYAKHDVHCAPVRTGIGADACADQHTYPELNTVEGKQCVAQCRSTQGIL